MSGIDTGGTITGVRQYIKSSKGYNFAPLNPKLRTVAIEPREQMLITEAKGFGPRLETNCPQGLGFGSDRCSDPNPFRFGHVHDT